MTCNLQKIVSDITNFQIDSFIDSKVYYAKFFYVLKIEKSNKTENAFIAIGCAINDKSYRFMKI